MKAEHIKVVAFDVDGVFTDGTLYYGANGDCMKAFSARDGMGISMVKAAGLRTAII
ncbi:MAG: 3-deoxy-D-manno-octulosonate 8-phosphate phosphatase, partial [Megasphaera micronuciformis]|nr:3-deoxy-D-manno-octulosonate 8-phosphate phosphatase [Megasphaera micronuciformis]